MFTFTKKQRAVAEIERRRGQESTYTTPLPRDALDLKDFLSEFYRNILFKRQADMNADLLQFPQTVGKHYKNLVPNSIAYEDFWQRYYYRTASIERVMAELEAADEATRQRNQDALQKRKAEFLQQISKASSTVTAALTINKSSPEVVTTTSGIDNDKRNTDCAFDDSEGTVLFASDTNNGDVLAPVTSTVTVDSIFVSPKVEAGHITEDPSQQQRVDWPIDSIPPIVSLTAPGPDTRIFDTVAKCEAANMEETPEPKACTSSESAQSTLIWDHTEPPDDQGAIQPLKPRTQSRELRVGTNSPSSSSSNVSPSSKIVVKDKVSAILDSVSKGEFSLKAVSPVRKEPNDKPVKLNSVVTDTLCKTSMCNDNEDPNIAITVTSDCTPSQVSDTQSHNSFPGIAGVYSVDLLNELSQCNPECLVSVTDDAVSSVLSSDPTVSSGKIATMVGLEVWKIAQATPIDVIEPINVSSPLFVPTDEHTRSLPSPGDDEPRFGNGTKPTATEITTKGRSTEMSELDLIRQPIIESLSVNMDVENGEFTSSESVSNIIANRSNQKQNDCIEITITEKSTTTKATPMEVPNDLSTRDRVIMDSGREPATHKTIDTPTPLNACEEKTVCTIEMLVKPSDNVQSKIDLPSESETMPKTNSTIDPPKPNHSWSFGKIIGGVSVFVVVLVAAMVVPIITSPAHKSIGDGLCGPMHPLQILVPSFPNNATTIVGSAPWWVPTSMKRYVFEQICGPDRIRTSFVWRKQNDRFCTIQILDETTNKQLWYKKKLQKVIVYTDRIEYFQDSMSTVNKTWVVPWSDHQRN